jgi:hypothetical protein
MNLTPTLYPHESVFLIGRHCYRCSFAVADFLSPKISRMHHSDVNLRQLRIHTQCRTVLKQLLCLTESSDLVIQPADRDLFISLSAALENSEMSSLIFELMGLNITLDDVSGRIHLKFDEHLESKPKLNFFSEFCWLFDGFFDFDRFRHSVSNFRPSLANRSQ